MNRINGYQNSKYRIFIHGYIVIIYACIYIIPSVSFWGEQRELQYARIIFFVFTTMIVFVMLKRLRLFDLLICFLAVMLALITKSLAPLSWISTVVLCRIIELDEGEYIKCVIRDTKMNYIALIFVFLYSFLYGYETIQNGNFQFARTAIYEVNQSGLAILCLGLIIKSKNNLIGNAVLCFGVLGLSRNYVLALIVLVVCNFKVISGKLIKLYDKGLLRFTMIMIVTTVIIIGIGILYLQWWENGEITFKKGISRINNLKDYSNFYRFSTNVAFINMIIKDPIHLLLGYSNIEDYRTGLSIMSNALNITTRGNVPHNFMLSYVRLYGISSILLIIYISRLLNHVISRTNIAIYLSICLYPIFMSAGFNTFWLYLTIFVLLIYNKSYMGENSRFKFKIQVP